MKSDSWLHKNINYADDGGTASIIQRGIGALPKQLGVEELRNISGYFPLKSYKAPDGTKKHFRKPTLQKIGNPFTYLAHGNEPSIDTDYASICIIGCAPGYDLEQNWPTKSHEERS